MKLNIAYLAYLALFGVIGCSESRPNSKLQSIDEYSVSSEYMVQAFGTLREYCNFRRSYRAEAESTDCIGVNGINKDSVTTTLVGVTNYGPHNKMDSNAPVKNYLKWETASAADYETGWEAFPAKLDFVTPFNLQQPYSTDTDITVNGVKSYVENPENGLLVPNPELLKNLNQYRFSKPIPLFRVSTGIKKYNCAVKESVKEINSFDEFLGRGGDEFTTRIPREFWKTNEGAINANYVLSIDFDTKRWARSGLGERSLVDHDNNGQIWEPIVGGSDSVICMHHSTSFFARYVKGSPTENDLYGPDGWKISRVSNCTDYLNLRNGERGEVVQIGGTTVKHQTKKGLVNMELRRYNSNGRISATTLKNSLGTCELINGSE